ncbi:MAG: helix-turn-helix transcriptional regulator [Propionibacteriaceae bacterium]|nr:helix-turn-helix transcriptional regulator [Propionibacteriaceae bacterium]
MGKQNMTQRALADALGVSEKKASALRGGRSWGLSDLDRVARLFDIPPADFIARSDWEASR